jgi:WD40 repeat protein
MFRSTTAFFPGGMAVGAAVGCGVIVLSLIGEPAAARRGASSVPSAPSGTIALATSEGRTVLLIAGSSGSLTRIRSPIEMVGLQIDLSSDGSQFVTTGRRGIWIFSRSGRNGRRVMIRNSIGQGPLDWVSWSPTSKEVAFASANGLFSVPAQGGDAALVLRASNVFEPDWSPQGKEIAFVRNAYSRQHGVIKERAGLIQIIRPDGSGLRTIVRGDNPDISPNGAELAFSRSDAVYIVQLAGGAPRRVVRHGAHPEWSPDGNYLAFTRNVSCNESGCFGRVFIVSAKGGAVKAVGPPIFDIGPLSWSPR